MPQTPPPPWQTEITLGSPWKNFMKMRMMIILQLKIFGIIVL